MVVVVVVVVAIVVVMNVSVPFALVYEITDVSPAAKDGASVIVEAWGYWRG